MSHEVARRRNVGEAMVWMIGLSAALFWLPVIGALIAGYVGGRKAGGVGPAIAAVFLPGFILWLFTFFLGGLLGGLPIIGQLFGLVAGFGAFVLSFMNVVPLVIGAMIGGVSAERQR